LNSKYSLQRRENNMKDTKKTETKSSKTSAAKEPAKKPGCGAKKK